MYLSEAEGLPLSCVQGGQKLLIQQPVLRTRLSLSPNGSLVYQELITALCGVTWPPMWSCPIQGQLVPDLSGFL